jgi:hypothetical protein
VTYTGNGVSGATIGHGLSTTAPKIVLIKKRNASDNWTMLNTNLSSLNVHLHLTTDGQISDPMFNNTAPTTSVFTVDADGQVNGNTNTFVAYCFSEVKGYSKFGSYTGNGNADGTFVYTGFKPAWLLIKRSDGGTDNWNLYDNKRLGYNTNYSFLIPNESNAENTTTSTANLDILSNGFKIRGSTGHTNTSGGTYIYMAFAESPFVNSNGVPNNAR